MADKYVPRLKEKYYAEVRDALQKQFNYPNPMMIPKFEKIVINMGVGEAATDAKAFDGRGNFSMGVTEQLIFPEIEYDKIDRTRGMDITFVTNAGDNDSAFALLSALGFPFKSK